MNRTGNHPTPTQSQRVTFTPSQRSTPPTGGSWWIDAPRENITKSAAIRFPSKNDTAYLHDVHRKDYNQP